MPCHAKSFPSVSRCTQNRACNLCSAIDMPDDKIFVWTVPAPGFSIVGRSSRVSIKTFFPEDHNRIDQTMQQFEADCQICRLTCLPLIADFVGSAVGADPYVSVQTSQGVTDVQQLGFNALPPYWVGPSIWHILSKGSFYGRMTYPKISFLPPIPICGEHLKAIRHSPARMP